MSREVDIVMPTRRKSHAFAALESLQHVPFPYRLHLVSHGETWAHAVNIALERTKGDVLLMDDDVELLPMTFRHFDPELGDVIGFKLIYPDGKIQHAGGAWDRTWLTHAGYGESAFGNYDVPRETHHVTASLMYVKRAVIDAVGPMAEDLPGYQFEDADFNFRAARAGFRIMYWPGMAIHHESLTKKTLPGFVEGAAAAWKEVRRRHPDLVPAAAEAAASR